MSKLNLSARQICIKLLFWSSSLLSREMPAPMMSQLLLIPMEKWKEVPDPVILNSSYHHAAGHGKGYQTQYSWLTTSCCILKRQRRSWWWLVIPRFFDRLTPQTSRLSDSCLIWSQTRNTEWTFDCFLTQKSDCPWGIQSAVEMLKEGKKDLLQGVTRASLQIWRG